MARVLRRILGPAYRALPLALRREVRTRWFESMARRGRFVSEEYEYGLLQDWLTDGDVAIDIGANFGTYTLRMSELVGDKGRVFAFEPVPQTFAVLTRILLASGCKNVTCMNVACSDANGLASIAIPDDPLTGEDLYRATVMEGGPSPLTICRIRLDDMTLPLDRLRVVKIDAERHETEVVNGMWNMILARRPVMIIEHLPEAACDRLASIGYSRSHQEGSPNSVFLPNQK